IGFQVPDTLVTNDPARAGQFYRRHKGNVILKATHHHSVEVKGKFYSMFSRVLHEADLRLFQDLVWAPSVLQERIRKKSELRVTIIGDRSYAASILPLASA